MSWKVPVRILLHSSSFGKCNYCLFEFMSLSNSFINKHTHENFFHFYLATPLIHQTPPLEWLWPCQCCGGPVIWRQSEECVKHPRKHELLFSHKYEKIEVTAVESFWRNQLVGWPWYVWDLDRGLGLGVVKVLGLKDLNWGSERTAEGGKKLDDKSRMKTLHEPENGPNFPTGSTQLLLFIPFLTCIYGAPN